MLQICVCGDGNFVVVLNTYCKQVRINLFPKIVFCGWYYWANRLRLQKSHFHITFQIWWIKPSIKTTTFGIVSLLSNVRRKRSNDDYISYDDLTQYVPYSYRGNRFEGTSHHLEFCSCVGILMLLSLETCSLLYSLHVTKSFELRKVYI